MQRPMGCNRVCAFKRSKDLHFEEKFWDVVGLYLDPTDRALVALL